MTYLYTTRVFLNRVLVSPHRSKKSKKRKAKKNRKQSASDSSSDGSDEDANGDLWVERTCIDEHMVGPEAPLTHLSQDDKPLE